MNSTIKFCVFLLKQTIKYLTLINIFLWCKKKYENLKSSSYYKTRRVHWLDRRILRKQLDIKPAYNYVQNQRKLMMQSRENGQKPQFVEFFWRFRGQTSRNCKFFRKIGFIQIEGHICTNFRPKTKKIVRAVSEKNIKVSDFGLIWRLFRKYL